MCVRSGIKSPTLPQLSRQPPTWCTPSHTTLLAPESSFLSLGRKAGTHGHCSRPRTSLGGQFTEAAGGQWSRLQPDPRSASRRQSRNEAEGTPGSPPHHPGQNRFLLSESYDSSDSGARQTKEDVPLHLLSVVRPQTTVDLSQFPHLQSGDQNAARLFRLYKDHVCYYM